MGRRKRRWTDGKNMANGRLGKVALSILIELQASDR